ncbi:hypothetical protein Pla52o_23650 [Novipirellula galeiformis]|uniref:Uncharacterized protein n=1 Tax=Novipirellula galeiformis TaxID=2528004 RepID=A0A5C6CJ32_9BACT|nr:hypothetical protein [Novipirellula galeiformis]TWU24438.1 hypothetical protein Pla52o_23650 [Novipirellula galeiformis]
MSRESLSTPLINDTIPSRRKFLGLTSLLVAGSVVSANTLAVGIVNADEKSNTSSRSEGESEITEPVTLAVNHDAQLFRVRMEMDVEGNVNIPANSLVSRKKASVIPLKSEAVFDYEERYRLPHDASIDSFVTAAERFYHEAESINDLNDVKRHSKLRREVAHTMVRRDTMPEILYSTRDSFTSNELELLRVPVSSVAVDGLLPVDAVVSGDQYVIEAESMRSLLNLTSIEQCEVKAEVVAISESDARIQVRGNVDGSVDGVPTKMRVVGKLTFDRKEGVTTWLAMAVHETREIGIAVPGFDVAATIKMVRQPLAKTIAMPATPFAVDVTAAIDPAALLIELQSNQVGISTRMDRRWRMISDVRGLSMMRMIENDRSIAQCDFRRLSKLPEGKQWSMEALQENIKTTLGEQLVQLELANERVNSEGLRVLSVVARGSVQEVPIRWVIQHFSDDSGRRAMATFTMEGDSVDAFATSDVQLSETLRFIDPNVAEEEAEIATRSQIKASRQDATSTPSASDQR